MQDWRFDELTRTLSNATSRRQVLKGLLGGLAAAAIARPSVNAAGGCDVARCKADADSLYQDEYQACKQDGSKGAGLCALWFLFQRYRNYKKCDRTGCFDGTCCGQQCASLYTDTLNCGACGHACPAGQECSGGRCSCGGNACGDCEDCVDGQCVSRCSDGTICCRNACVSDQCTPPLVFNPATCDCVCPGGDSFCNGQCVDTYSDDNNCGSCGNKCGNCEQCSFGVCTPINCGSGLDCCNGRCVDACPAGQQHDPSTCQCVCATGDTCGPFCCDGGKICCPDTLSGMSCRDPNGNCGCGVPCGDMCCGQYEFCCKAADSTYHCVASSGDTC